MWLSRSASSPTMSSRSAASPSGLRMRRRLPTELKITPSGLRTSWAMLAESSPSAAMRSRSISSFCVRASSA
jgi:hypothetical protein